MAVAFDAVGPSSSGATNSTGNALTWSHVCGASASYLLVGCALDANPDTGFTMTATYNGVAMTSLGTLQSGSSGFTAGFIQVWGLANPATGTHNVVVTPSPSGTAHGLNGGSMSFTGAGQLSATQTAVADNATATLGFTGSVSGNIVAMFCCGGNPLTSTAGTSRYVVNGDNVSAAGNGAGSTVASGGTVTCTWTQSSSAWGIIAVEVQPPAAAAAPIRPAVRARLPLQPVQRGRCYSSPPAPVRNPVPGPVFRQKPAPVRFILPPWQPRAGRIGSSFGAPVVNPIHGPPVYPPLGPVRARLPQLQPRAGRVASSPGAPVRNPSQGPAFVPFRWPVQAVDPLPHRGRTYATAKPTAVAVPPPVAGPPFYPAVQAIRARLPQQQFTLQGRTGSNPGTLPPLHLVNSFDGGTNGAAVSTGNSGGASGNAFSVVTIGSSATLTYNNTFYAHGSLSAKFTTGASSVTDIVSWTSLVGIQPTIWFRLYAYFTASPASTVRLLRAMSNGTQCGGLSLLSTGKLAMVNAAGTAAVTTSNTIPLNQWFRVEGFIAGSANAGQLSVSLFTLPDAQIPAETDTSSATQATTGPINAVQYGVTGAVANVASFYLDSIGLSNTGYLGPASYAGAASQGYPAQARIVPAGTMRGRVYASAGAAAVTPSPSGPAVYPLPGPVRTRTVPPFSKGRTSGSPGAPVRNPSAGPVFTQAVRPARPPVPQTFSKGRVSANPGAPARNPVQGPVFRQATTPARIRPSLPPRGRVSSNPGGPVQNPVPGVTGPPFFPFRSPVRVHPVLPPRGRTASSPGAPVRNPVQGPVFQQAVHPAAVRLPVPLLKGRVAFNAGAPVVHAGPALTPLHGPVQARSPLPARGRVTSNPGTPAAAPAKPAPVYPWHGPVQARRPLPPRGRAFAGGPGGPVRNPHAGPAVYPLHGPIGLANRAPGPFRKGSAQGNRGGLVANIPFATLRFRTGSPFFQWETEDPGFQWEAADPGFQWATGDPEAG